MTYNDVSHIFNKLNACLCLFTFGYVLNCYTLSSNSRIYSAHVK